MILTEHEQVIINNMRHPSIRTLTASKSYKDLSDEELTSLIGKIDDYVNEIGETQRAFGNYDEFYVFLRFHMLEMLDWILIRNIQTKSYYVTPM